MGVGGGVKVSRVRGGNSGIGSLVMWAAHDICWLGLGIRLGLGLKLGMD